MGQYGSCDLLRVFANSTARPLRMSECTGFSLGCFLCSMMLSLDAHKQVFKIFTLIKLII